MRRTCADYHQGSEASGFRYEAEYMRVNRTSSLIANAHSLQSKRPVITGCLQGDACWMMEAPERR